MLPRYERRQGRYHVIDRRSAFNTYKASLAAALDDQRDLKRYPFKLELSPTVGSDNYEENLAVWEAAYDSRLDEDQRIVRHCANRSEHDFDQLANEIDPQTAQKRREGRGGEILDATAGRTITDAWHDLLARLRGRWMVLEPLVTSTDKLPRSE